MYRLYILRDPREPMNIRYVGITSKELEQRLKEHLKDATSIKNSHKCNWIRKIMKESVYPMIELIDVLPTWEDACEAEKREIKILLEDGYKLVNSTLGGEGCLGLKHSEETKQRLSIITKKQMLDPAQIEKQRVGHLGKKTSQETKEKLRIASTGRIKSIETRAKLSAAHKGKKLSPDTIAKIKESRGRHPIIDQNNTIYMSLLDASIRLKISVGNIWHVLKGNRKQTRGYTFQYKS